MGERKGRGGLRFAIFLLKAVAALLSAMRRLLAIFPQVVSIQAQCRRVQLRVVVVSCNRDFSTPDQISYQCLAEVLSK